MTRFALHPAARLIVGGQVTRLGPSAGGVVAALPVVKALSAALSGQPFRIGGTGALEARDGDFETLTSGSSGAPRRIRRNMASWAASFAVNAGLFGIGPGVSVAVLGGLEQSLALYAAVEGLSLGATVHLLAGMRPDRQAAALAGVAVLYATPAQLRLLVGAGLSMPDLRVVVVGGAKLDATLRAGLTALASRAAIREFYGAAEASFITMSGPDDPVESVGRPYPGVDLRIDAAPGAVGEVWVRSPYLFDGYGGVAPLSGAARWQDGWLSVGEMGRLVAGRLHLAGRAGRMVTVADQNVFPEEVEAYLASLPGVLRAAVVPEADALRGARLVAVVQGPADAGDILDALRDRLGPTLAPKRVVHCASWPELPSGKTDFRALERWVGGTPTPGPDAGKGSS